MKCKRIIVFLSNIIEYIKTLLLIELVSLGLVRGRRKIVALYGECHMDVVGGILSRHKAFRKKYILLWKNNISILSTRYKRLLFSEKLWKNVDLLVYNAMLPPRSGSPNISEVLKMMGNKEGISVTNAAFKGYFPQHTADTANKDKFAWGDRNINDFVSKGMDRENIYLELSSRDFYSQEAVLSFWNKAIVTLKAYEKNCDIMISDYLEDNGRKSVLYYSVTHPSFDVMLELTNRILERINVERVSGVRKGDVLELENHAEPVYPSVYAGLGMKDKSAQRLVSPGNQGDLYDFREYVYEYAREIKIKQYGGGE